MNGGLSNDVSENVYLFASSIWVLYVSDKQLKGGRDMPQISIT